MMAATGSMMHEPLSAAKLCKALFPYSAQLNLDFETLCEVLTFRWLELRKVAWQ